MTDGSDLHTTRAPWLQNFITMYENLGEQNNDAPTNNNSPTNNAHQTDPQDFTPLLHVYHADVEFIDPLHHLNGVSALVAYFQNMYTNVASCQFVIDHVIESENEAAIYWTMTYTHKNLNGKQPIEVVGHSHLKQREGMVAYHRDYLDVGAMVYEHIPLLGRMITAIKNRAGKL